MQGSVFLQFGQNNVVVGAGRIVGGVGKSGDHWLVEYAGRPSYRRIFNLEALANFAIFANEKDRADFLNPPKPALPAIAEEPQAVEAVAAPEATEAVAAE